MSIHICKCVHNGREEYHLRYPGMTKEAAQELADSINAGVFGKPAQPSKPWVGLTDEEMNEWTPEIHAVIQAIEAKLREKNNG